MDTSEAGVMIVGATNLPFEIDAAVRRRFEKRIFVELPDLESRRDMALSWISS